MKALVKNERMTLNLVGGRLTISNGSAEISLLIRPEQLAGVIYGERIPAHVDVRVAEQIIDAAASN